MTRHLDSLLDSLLLTEDQTEIAKKFYRKTRKNRPEMAADLSYAASHALGTVRDGESAEENVGALKKVFKHNDDIDPSQTGDTFGVKTFIDVMATDNKEAGEAKRLYTNSLKSIFSDLYEMTEEEYKTKKDSNTVTLDNQEEDLLMDDEDFLA